MIVGIQGKKERKKERKKEEEEEEEEEDWEKNPLRHCTVIRTLVSTAPGISLGRSTN